MNCMTKAVPYKNGATLEVMFSTVALCITMDAYRGLSLSHVQLQMRSFLHIMSHNFVGHVVFERRGHVEMEGGTTSKPFCQETCVPIYQ